MFHLVDWISFTIDSPMDQHGGVSYLDPNNLHIVRRQVLSKVYQKVGKAVMDTLFNSLPMNEEAGRFPYRYSLIDSESSSRIFYDAQINNILVEISGRGSKLLSDEGLVSVLCAAVSTRCTRIDVSADLATDVSPIEFINAGYSERFGSTSTHTSQTGTTCYVGSPKSDRRAAVYRYNAPHPRSPYLRVEHRFKGDRARQMAEYIVEHSVPMAVAAAGDIFGWQHDIWEPAIKEIADLPELNVDARSGPFVLWLLKQVFPAMRRAEREGTIPDLRAFIQMHLFDDDDSETDLPVPQT